MHPFHRPWPGKRPGLAFVLLATMLTVIWFAGGASRADVLGQTVVRGAAWVLLATAAITGIRPRQDGAKPVWWIALAISALVALQLVPLPPSVWQALPGRAAFAEAATAGGFEQPWRPWSVVPAATFNALSSLIIPIVVLFFASALDDRERAWLPNIVLGMIAAALLPGLLQFSGVGFINPLINQRVGEVSSVFANRNHFALFLGIGVVIAPTWALMNDRQILIRMPLAVILALLFLLMILATGSRAGLVVGILALVLAVAIAGPKLTKLLHQQPRWLRLSLAAIVPAAIALIILASIFNNRAASLNRIIDINATEDFRVKAMPVVIEMVRYYLPAGTGFGSFDTMFRMHEPFNLLKLSYFNHAHNDFLEVVLDSGLPGAILTMVTLFWWLIASVRVWRNGIGKSGRLARIGSSIILLVLVASAVDYPARTPTIMAMLALGAWWLGIGVPAVQRSALPSNDPTL